MTEQQQNLMTTAQVTTTPLPPLNYTTDERELMGHQVELITSNVVLSVRAVIEVAQQLENLVVENAARVRAELNEHCELAELVSKEAAQLGDTISKLRDAQAEIVVARKTGSLTD